MAISSSFFSNSNFSFHVASSSLPCTPGILNMQQEIKTKDAIFQVSQVNVRRKVNTTRVGATDRNKPHPSSRTILLKPTMMLDQRIHSPKMVSKLGFGKMVDDFVLRENFNIRTYEIGPNRTLSIETLMNYLQETSINHMNAIGVLGDGLGNTPEMCKKNLIWVMAKMQVVVDRYPIWGDVVQIDTWKVLLVNL
ncbi:palmitoyl-acyl carrier protein thioesterase, chloroplastic-like protein, partial [Tanacetum coccineum]